MENNPKEVERLIDDLQHGDEQTRRYAAEDLGYGKYDEGVPYLIRGLSDTTIAVAEQCASALVRIGGSEVAKNIAPHLATEDVRLRNYASEIMSLLGETAVSTLSYQLQSEDRDVRMFSVDILSKICSKNAIETLVKALDDHDVNIAASAADGLGDVGDEEHLPILKKYISAEVWMKCAVLRGMGKIGGFKALEAILPMLNDMDTCVKISAIKALGQIGDIKAMPRLLEILRNELIKIYGNEIIEAIFEIIEKNPTTDFSNFANSLNISPLVKFVQSGPLAGRIKAINILGSLKSDEVLPVVVELFKENIQELRDAAIKALIQIQPKNIEHLISILESDNSSNTEKEAVLKCIGKLNHHQTAAIFITFLKSDNINLQLAALRAVHGNIEPVPIEEIKSLLKSEDKQVRLEAVITIRKFNLSKFVKPLIEALKDDDPDVLNAIDDTLIHIGNNGVSPSLKPYLDSFSKQERKIAFEYFGVHNPQKLVQKFTEGLQDPSVEIRVIAFKVLTNLKLVTLDMIRHGILDPVESVRIQSIRALSSLAPSTEMLNFIQLSLTTTQYERLKVELIQVLAGLDNVDTLPFLKPLLNDESTWVQVEVVEALRDIGDKTILKDLKKLLNSENVDLVDTVKTIIKEIDNT